MVDVEVGLKISDTLPFTMKGKVLILMVEVDLGLILAPLPLIIKVSVVDTWVFIFMVMR